MDSVTLEQAAATERPRLLGLAYRMLGSRTDAEDIVQEALLRAHRAPPQAIDSPAAYLTTITTRLAIDHLRSARVRRETYAGPWLPEPIDRDPAPDAAARAVLDDTISIAFLLLLEALSPDERAVLVLHDVFAYSHAEIAATLERTDASSRQLLRRARQRLAADRPRRRTDPAHRDDVVRRFIAACDGGDVGSFLDLLTTDAELLVDGGPGIRTAARRPIRGADRIARFMTYALSRMGPERRVSLAMLNDGPAALVHGGDGEPLGAVFVQPADDGRAASIHWVRDPSKLSAVAQRSGPPRSARTRGLESDGAPTAPSDR